MFIFGRFSVDVKLCMFVCVHIAYMYSVCVTVCG